MDIERQPTAADAPFDRELDYQNALAYGASIFSQKQNFINDRKRYYWEEYLKSDHWKDLRAKKLKSATTCEKCHCQPSYDVHHDRYRNLIDVTTDDLKAFCRRCHKLEHRLINRENSIEWRRRIQAASYWLRCAVDHLEDMLQVMGIKKGNVQVLNTTTVFKLGLLRSAFETRPIARLRVAYLMLQGQKLNTYGPWKLL